MYIRKTGYVTRQNTEGQTFFGGYTSYKEPKDEPYIVWKTGYVLSRKEEEKSRRISKSAELAVAKTQTINEIRQANSPYYAIVSKNGACNVCSSQHGIAYPVSSAIVGENFPPFHPNCKCDVALLGSSYQPSAFSIFTTSLTRIPFTSLPGCIIRLNYTYVKLIMRMF